MENQDKKFVMTIQPLVDKVRALCNQNDIPCFMAFGTSQNPDQTYNIKCETLLPELFGQKSVDRRFVDFVKIQAGFETAVIPHKMNEFADISDEKIVGTKIKQENDDDDELTEDELRILQESVEIEEDYDNDTPNDGDLGNDSDK